MRRLSTMGVLATTTLTLALCAVGCGDNGGPAAAEAGKPVEEVVKRGPITVTSRVDNDKPSVADLITLELIVEADKGVEIELPQKAHVKALEANTLVRDERSTGPIETPEGRNRWTRTYEVEAFVSGELKLPALAVHYKDRRKAGPGAAPTTQPAADWPRMESKPLTVKVSSVAPDDADPTKIADIAGPVGLPSEGVGWGWIALGGAVVLLLIVLLAVWVIRRSRLAPELQRREPAHVIALRELERIVAMNLVEQGLIEEFYFRVSGVLREYIENRFGLRAPERTTTEFLTELTDARQLTAEQKDLLARFLQHCDMVKFARYGPADSEVQSTFDLVRHFVTSTQAAEAEAPAAVEAAP